MRQAIQEFLEEQTSRTEPAYKAELVEERKRREQLERRLNEVVEESKRSRQAADQAERGSAIRAELQRLGVAKIDLAYRAVQESIFRTEDGRLLAHGDSGEVPAKEYLASFVSENPEFLPARISGGSGITGARKAPPERQRRRGHGGHPAGHERRRHGTRAQRDRARSLTELTRHIGRVRNG